MARIRLHQRLGAFGFTVTMGLVGAGTLVRACDTSATKPAVRVAPPAATTVVQIVNQQRAAAGVPAVAENVLLDAAAKVQSADQASRQVMTHSGADGSDAGQRLEIVGFAWSTWGENVAAGQATPSQVMDAWMNSSGHRRNILDPAFTNIGVASTQGANGVVYWTMDLATPR
ncbi:MAG: Cysteine-rich secretory protein family protein [Ilumatobacteraceae bacterium]|nr:Cysteine-rich secretory protein family protein [Ilumatobacteraceae bacterium]